MIQHLALRISLSAAMLTLSTAANHLPEPLARVAHTVVNLLWLWLL